MLKRAGPDLPRHMEGGPDNPLGARAMYLGSTLYRIHGTNEPWTIGKAVSSGCIRMRNEDVIDLYERVKRRHARHRDVKTIACRKRQAFLSSRRPAGSQPAAGCDKIQIRGLQWLDFAPDSDGDPGGRRSRLTAR